MFEILSSAAFASTVVPAVNVTVLAVVSSKVIASVTTPALVDLIATVPAFSRLRTPTVAAPVPAVTEMLPIVDVPAFATAPTAVAPRSAVVAPVTVTLPIEVEAVSAPALAEVPPLTVILPIVVPLIDVIADDDFTEDKSTVPTTNLVAVLPVTAAKVTTPPVAVSVDSIRIEPMLSAAVAATVALRKAEALIAVIVPSVVSAAVSAPTVIAAIVALWLDELAVTVPSVSALIEPIVVAAAVPAVPLAVIVAIEPLAVVATPEKSILPITALPKVEIA